MHPCCWAGRSLQSTPAEGPFCVHAPAESCKTLQWIIVKWSTSELFLAQRWFIVEGKQVKRVKKVLDACPALGHFCSDSDVEEGTRVFVHVGCNWSLIHFLGSCLHPVGSHLDYAGLPSYTAWPPAELCACNVPEKVQNFVFCNVAAVTISLCTLPAIKALHTWFQLKERKANKLTTKQCFLFPPRTFCAQRHRKPDPSALGFLPALPAGWQRVLLQKYILQLLFH